MRILVSVVLGIFGLAAVLWGSVGLFAGEEGAGMGARVSYILGGLLGAGLLVSGAALGRNLAWARPYALANLAGMAALSIVSAARLYGQTSAPQHATRALLALVLMGVLLKHPSARHTRRPPARG